MERIFGDILSNDIYSIDRNTYTGELEGIIRSFDEVSCVIKSLRNHEALITDKITADLLKNRDETVWEGYAT